MAKFDKWTTLREFVSHQPGGGLILQHMNELDAEEAFLKPPAPILKIGDKVKHAAKGWSGEVVKIAASGLRVLIKWDENYWTPSYIEIRNLLIEEATYE